ncbi:hypothetical protein MLD38_004341 [Melastoma candidum]|uniref:Uncharacterized protein n=1 Tax=Melastoma candidum TaxID=119954 RepID=A0ACB9S5R0_9MYRT|nr:hypothetical protein MLD38_004341 [Melastoma candidum]
MLLSLLLLGTWPALFTLLKRRGRLPQHTYLDYSLSNLLYASSSPSPSAGLATPPQSPQLPRSVLSGPHFCLPPWIPIPMNFLYLVMTGMPINYFLDNKINSPDILFSGVACFVIAVCLASAVHTSIASDI